MLINDPITLVPYNSRWADEFESESSRIRVAPGGTAVRVDHVGSTAVPGLAAKPVIDIQVSVRKLHPLELHLGSLIGLGYTHVPHLDDETYPFLHRPSTWPHTHHIHLCESGGNEERRHLAFRDYLRDHRKMAMEYAVEKQRLATRFSSSTSESRNAYADAKSSFIEPIVRRALKLGYPKV